MIQFFYIGPYIVIHAEQNDSRWLKYKEKVKSLCLADGNELLDWDFIDGKRVYYSEDFVEQGPQLQQDSILTSDYMEETAEERVKCLNDGGKYFKHLNLIAEMFGSDAEIDFGIIRWCK